MTLLFEFERRAIPMMHGEAKANHLQGFRNDDALAFDAVSHRDDNWACRLSVMTPVSAPQDTRGNRLASWKTRAHPSI
jgi:hypothetical protein